MDSKGAQLFGLFICLLAFFLFMWYRTPTLGNGIIHNGQAF